MPAKPCSLLSCGDHGREVDSTFTAVVMLGRKPLKGVTVEVHGAGSEQVLLIELTDEAGKARFWRLAPGDYWIYVTYLDISAGQQCFHVARSPSLSAKRRLTYTWGDYGIAMRGVAGRFLRHAPYFADGKRSNVARRDEVPIAGVALVLQNAVTRETWHRTSNETGAFAFPPLTDGTYVLHAQGSAESGTEASASLVLTVAAAAPEKALSFRVMESGCGGEVFAAK